MNKSVLIIEAGSSKADWAYLTPSPSDAYSMSTDGFNPYTHTVGHFEEQLSKVISKITPQYPFGIFYYGAGISEATQNIVSEVFKNKFPLATIEVASDLLGAARSTSQANEGIVCISGTGSNACSYNGHSILQKINTLGYVLGDEGSGNHLGKALLRAYFYGQLPSELEAKFTLSHPKLTRSAFLQQLHKSDHPNAYLASYAKFLHLHKDHIFIKSLILNSFKAFICLHILPLHFENKYPINFVGSIGYYFQNEWKKALSEYNLSIGNFVLKPIDGLIEYHKI